MITVLPFAIRFALLAWYAALVVHGHPWWALPLLVLFALGWGIGKVPNFSSVAKRTENTAQSATHSNQAAAP